MILEIEALKIRLKCIEEQKEQLTKLMYTFTSPVKELKAMIYDDMPKGNHAVEYEYLIDAMSRLDSMELIDTTILKSLIEQEKLIDAKLQVFEGLEYKVAYMRAKGMSCQAIATELNHTLGYIQNISAKVSKRESIQ